MTEPTAPEVAVIVVAAGSGSRLGRMEPKAFVPLGGRTLLERALLTVFGMRDPVQVIVVVPKTHVTEALTISYRAARGTAVDVVAGGTTRQASVTLGLAALHPDVRTVLVHDAARALTPAALCDGVVDAVRASGHGIVPGLALVDTIKSVSAAGGILATVNRGDLTAVQTPQGFPREMLAAATAAADSSLEATDDAGVVAAAGYPVSVIPGDPLAFKITTQWDLTRAESLLGATEPVDFAPRVGTGLDVHAFDDGAELWLAGLHWPGERGLSGHSDGDAAVHAICDALLSAAGLGDIGGVFGLSDPRLDGAHGDVFLRETLRVLSTAGFRVGNVSVQIIGNRPKVSARRAEAETLLGAWLNAPVAVAATTTDALGFTGRGEGLAAIATALIFPEHPAHPHLSWEV